MRIYAQEFDCKQEGLKTGAVATLLMNSLGMVAFFPPFAKMASHDPLNFPPECFIITRSLGRVCYSLEGRGLQMLTIYQDCHGCTCSDSVSVDVEEGGINIALSQPLL